MQAGTYIPGASLLHGMNTAAKLLSFFVLLAAVVMTDSLWGYGLMIGSTVLIVRLSHIKWKDAVKPVSGLWLFFVFIFIMNAVFFSTEQVLWSWWIFHISTAGMIQGANLIFRIVLILILGNVLVSVTTPIEMTGAIETLLRPLALFGIPVGDVAMILGAALQFIPVFLEETELIQKAQIARGARLESRRLKDRAESMIPLVVPVFVSAFRRADELAIAMEARGYRRAGGRTKRLKAPFRLRDLAALFVSCAICAVQMVL